MKYIIDGQHAFNALLRNNMDIPYVTIKIDNKVQLVESIALLNASSKNWTLLDYITSWSCVSEDYKKLLHYYNVYDLELGNIAVVLMERNTDNGNITKGLIRLNSDGTPNQYFANGFYCDNCQYQSGTDTRTGLVRAIAVQSDGKILVGGSFNQYSGVSGINYIVRFTKINIQYNSSAFFPFFRFPLLSPPR